MLRLALLAAVPGWSAASLFLVQRGGRRAAWAATVVVALALAAWAASRVGTGNPVSRTARWDQWLAFVLGAAMLLPAGLAIAWGVAAAAADGRAWWTSLGAGILAGLAAVPVAFALAVLVDVLWPH